ncbi:MAG: division/cell wall cluster transcriptional repressor MraZ, partial [Atribacterota bacterium]
MLYLWWIVGASGEKWKEGEEKVFLGQFRHKVDGKGRITIPNEFRKDLSSTLYLTKGIETCIFIFTEEEWLKIACRIAALPLARKVGREFARIFLANATAQVIDGQGRVMIPKHLREHAQIEKKAVTVGVGTRIEVWAENWWDQY